MSSMHTLGEMFLTLSSLSSHQGSNAANVFMGLRKFFISHNLERWMEDSLRTFLTSSFFFHKKRIFIENNPELTKVSTSTTFLPLFKWGTFSSQDLRLELLGNRKGWGSTSYRRGVVGGLKLMLVLCPWLCYTTRRDSVDLTKITNQLTLN